MTIATSSSVKTCTCRKCVTACEQNPGFMTPDEARAAIAAGHAKMLMREWIDGWEPEAKARGFPEKVWLLVPASAGCGGRDAPQMPEYETMAESFIAQFTKPWRRGRCVFLKDRRCSIHDSGFKPWQCRETLACAPDGSPGPDNYDVGETWNNPEAQALVDEWRATVKHEEDA